jgi:hypothetical protein
MNYLLIGIFFIAALVQTIRRGPGYVFAYVYLPVQLLLSTVAPAQVQPLPDITGPVAVSYGLVIGMLISGRFMFFKPHFIDLLVVLCSVSIIITGYVNGEFWTIVSATGNETLRWLVPYYMARLAFRDATVRRQMGISLCFVAMAMGLIGMIEFRLFPLFFSRILQDLGMAQVYNTMVLGRFGFFRAMVTAEHPIDLGNVGLLLGGLVPALCISSGISTRDWRLIGGLAGSAMILISSMSFSCLAGAGVAMGIYILLRYVRGSELLLMPGMVAAIIAGFAFTIHLINLDINTIRPADGGEVVAFDGSYYVRVLIIQNSWNSYGQGAGWVGFGDDGLKKEVLGLESVDNSYMLFLMRRGWVHLTLRMLMALSIAYIGWKMLQRARGQVERAPAAALVGAMIGIMVAMYTVWFGFVYAIIWTCTLAMAVSMRQMMAERMEARRPVPIPEYGRGQSPLIAQPA